jgi:hypothetical protein
LLIIAHYSPLITHCSLLTSSLLNLFNDLALLSARLSLFSDFCWLLISGPLLLPAHTSPVSSNLSMIEHCSVRVCYYYLNSTGLISRSFLLIIYCSPPPSTNYSIIEHCLVSACHYSEFCRAPFSLLFAHCFAHCSPLASHCSIRNACEPIPFYGIDKCSNPVHFAALSCVELHNAAQRCASLRNPYSDRNLNS